MLISWKNQVNVQGISSSANGKTILPCSFSILINSTLSPADRTDDTGDGGIDVPERAIKRAKIDPSKDIADKVLNSQVQRG